ncbi:hypothetical protein AUJ46_06420 [Candidatus Peregrinibacteria bacterium CG1_02_54_53]|nr:MAG: hypothetical protein AUJ46_06420 [Candidatus Peregrinibacteria bacterium CG1_02_54_53]
MKKRPAVLIAVASALGIAGIAIAASQISDTFADTSKISQSYQLNVDTTAGQVKLAVWNCGDSFTDYRDGTAYTTVLIGTQCWMAKNLNYGTRVNGSGNQTNNGTVEKYCYSDSDANCTTYGGLYQWDEAMDYSSSCNGTGEGSPACASPVRGICPDGWHIPSHYEYVALERAVCTSGTCTTDFPYDTSTTGWRGTNEGTSLKQNGASGFEGLLAGYRDTDGSFSGLGSNGHFWSSLESGSSAWGRSLYSGNATVYRGTYSKAYGFSIRCLKD